MDHSQIIERVREAFRASMDEDKEVASLYDRVAKGAATYADADRFASIAGRKMGGILASELVDQEIAGELTMDMLRDVLPKTLWTDYDAVSKLTQQVQQALNEAAGLRMLAAAPIYDRQRVYGMAEEVARQHEESSFAEHVQTFLEQVENLSLHTVDSSVEENARTQYEAGLAPKIVRTQMGRCCKLCQELLGTYDYEKVRKGNKEVFWRHTSCRCQVLYQPGDGRVQNAHTKRWYSEEERDSISARIEESNSRRLLHKRAALFTEADPMHEVTGDAEKSNPEEVEAFVKEIEDSGVELKMRRRGSNSYGYTPGLTPGKPGQVIMTEGASYSAWCHEMRHMRDDREAGWSGMRVLIDIDECIRREEAAYSEEILLAEQAGRHDVAEQLKKNLELEKKKINGEID